MSLIIPSKRIAQLLALPSLLLLIHELALQYLVAFKDHVFSVLVKPALLRVLPPSV